MTAVHDANAPEAGTSAAHAAQGEEKKSKQSKRFHTINVADLIVHQYDEKEVILRRAHKIANEIIIGELRQGEFMRNPKPGVFQLYLPALSSDAGALRCSVVAGQIAREISRINPGKITLNDRADEMMARHANEPRPVGRSAGIAAGAKAEAAKSAEAAEEAEQRRQANMALELMISANTMRLEELLGKDPAEVAAALRVSFEPVWQARKKVVSAYVCALDETGEDAGADGAGDVIAQMSPSQKDAAVLLKVGRVLEEARAEGTPGLMIVPVHFSTLDNAKFASAYLEALSTIPEKDRELLVFKVTAIPGDASRFRLREAIAALRNRCRSLVASVDVLCADLARFADAGFLGLGLSVDEKHGEQRLMRLMNDFTRAAEKARLLTFVSGLKSKSLLLGCYGAGFDYMSGSVVAAPLAAPSGIRRMEIDLMYASAAAAPAAQT